MKKSTKHLDRVNKRLGLFVPTLIMAFVIAASACNKASDESIPTPAPRVDSMTTVPSESTASFGETVEAGVGRKAAYIFSDNDKSVLYGALDYQNTGDSPLCVKGAQFKFLVDGSEMEFEMTQPSYEACVVYPGETGYLAGWFELESGVSYSTVELKDAVLSCEAHDASRSILTVSDCTVMRNYPEFATLTGNITPEKPSEGGLSLIYTAFYDENDALLGVWYFTDDISASKSDSFRFSTHMRNLKIADLENNTKNISAVAYGLNEVYED